jgi:hypothetical protein
MLFFSWILTNSAQASQCSTPFALVMLENRLNSANEALARGDLKSFHNQIDSINYSIPCIIQPLDKLAATKLHLLIGLNYWLDVKTDVAENHFSSVKSLKQTTQIPATWLPNDTQLRGFFDKTKGSSDVQGIPKAPEGYHYFDGMLTNQQPLYRPTVYQYVVDDRVVQTKILQPGEKIPAPKSPKKVVVQVQEQPTEKYAPPSTTMPTYDNTLLTGTPNLYLMGSGLSGGITFGAIVASRRAKNAWYDVEYITDDEMQSVFDDMWNIHKKSRRMAWIFGTTTAGLAYMGYQELNPSFGLQDLIPSKDMFQKNKSKSPDQTGEEENDTSKIQSQSDTETSTEVKKKKSPKKKSQE